ncbi:hypothetical protein ACIXOF_07935 [Bacteroides fragilis]
MSAATARVPAATAARVSDSRPSPEAQIAADTVSGVPSGNEGVSALSEQPAVSSRQPKTVWYNLSVFILNHSF